MKLDLPYLVSDMDRHGNARMYVRKRGCRKVRIKELPGSAAFIPAYEAALIKVSEKTPAPTNKTSGKGTLGWLTLEYAASFAFKQLGLRQQRVRRQILEACLAEPLAPGSALLFRDCPVGTMEPKHIKVLRDRKANMPGAANNRLKVLRVMLSWAIEERDEFVKRNVAKDVKPLSYSEKGFHSWTQAEVLQFAARHPIGSKARLAFALLAYTGMRRSDCVQLGPHHVKDGWITFTVRKTGKPLQLPVLPQLQEIIDATPPGMKSFLETGHCKPFSANGFGNWFRDQCNAADLPNCTAHGLRKAGAAIAAENGATEKQLMAMFGWTTPKMAAHYSKGANQKKLAGDAMHLLVQPTHGPTSE